MNFELSYKGKKMEDCSREELLEAIKFFTDNDNKYREYYENMTIKNLQFELKIKNELLEKALRK